MSPDGQTEFQPESVAFSPDGKTVVTGSLDKTARLWDASTGGPIGKLMLHKSAVDAVAFSPDGKTVLTGSWGDTGWLLWDVRTGKPFGRGPWCRLRIALRPLWDAVTDKPIDKAMRYENWVCAVAFSPDGKIVLTGSRDNAARLWDALTPMRCSAAPRRSS